MDTQRLCFRTAHVILGRMATWSLGVGTGASSCRHARRMVPQRSVLLIIESQIICICWRGNLIKSFVVFITDLFALYVQNASKIFMFQNVPKCAEFGKKYHFKKSLVNISILVYELLFGSFGVSRNEPIAITRVVVVGVVVIVCAQPSWPDDLS